MTAATWNVNSVRRRLPLLLDWLAQHRPDVICLQETKTADAEFPAEPLQRAGYHVHYRGRKGYNGVATLSVRQPESVRYGLDETGAEDDRILTSVVDGVTIVNAYVPQGFKVNSEKYAFKLEWFRRLRRYFNDCLDPRQPVLWMGDLNVAPEPIDVYHPDRRVNDVDFHIDARNAYKDVVAWGLTDVFRMLHPETVQYTYWDYFRNAFQNNWGWRIDHILATAPLARLCLRAEVDLEPRRAPAASDHTVVWAEFDCGSRP
jgi:exodeoxyribonuclease-3